MADLEQRARSRRRDGVDSEQALVDLAAAARPRVALQEAEDVGIGSPFASRSKVARRRHLTAEQRRASARRRATLSTALSLLEPGACPHAPGFAENGGQGARRIWLLSGVVRAQRAKAIEPRPLQIVLAPREGQRPRPNLTLGFSTAYKTL